MKTVEKKECKTVLENVCAVNFVTECAAKEEKPASPIDSYGAPEAPLLRSKRRVADFFWIFKDMGDFQR